MTFRAPDYSEVLRFKSLHSFIKIDYRGLHSLMKRIGIFLDTFWKIICHTDHTCASIVSRASIINLIQPPEIITNRIKFFLPPVKSPQ